MPYVELIADINLSARDALLALSVAGQAAKKASLVSPGSHHVGQVSAHRKADRRYYVFFDSPSPSDIRSLLSEKRLTNVDVVETSPVCDDACENCGNITGVRPPAVCPACGFREISACPHCHTDYSRLDYIDDAGHRIYRCPNCNGRVRMRFNDPLELPDGKLNQPMILVIKVGL
jgi:DNA-directed RNA polymerase subunit RPC12/RpoP